MKNLKILMVVLAAAFMIGIVVYSKTLLKVPDVSILRVAVPRISASTYDVGEQYCLWRTYIFNGSTSHNAPVRCLLSITHGNGTVPTYLMKWKVPTTRDTDRCTITDKSEKCKKIVKIFLMQWLFTAQKQTQDNSEIKKALSRVRNDFTIVLCLF